MYCSIRQALSVYNDLRYAMEGKASHGHDTEIYAYRLMPNHPRMILENYKSDPVEILGAANSLVDIINIFCEENTDVSFYIEAMEPNYWLKEYGNDFDHRVLVQCRPENKNKKKEI